MLRTMCTLQHSLKFFLLVLSITTVISQVSTHPPIFSDSMVHVFGTQISSTHGHLLRRIRYLATTLYAHTHAKIPFPHPDSHSYLLSQGDGLWSEVDLQLEDGACPGPLARDVEDPALHH